MIDKAFKLPLTRKNCQASGETGLKDKESYKRAKKHTGKILLTFPQRANVVVYSKR